MTEKELHKTIKRNEKVIKQAKRDLRAAKMSFWLYAASVVGILFINGRKRAIQAAQGQIAQAEANIMQAELALASGRFDE